MDQNSKKSNLKSLAGDLITSLKDLNDLQKESIKVNKEFLVKITEIPKYVVSRISVMILLSFILILCITAVVFHTLEWGILKYYNQIYRANTVKDKETLLKELAEIKLQVERLERQ